MKKLNEILSGECQVQDISFAQEDVCVDSLCFDSRKITAGSLFVAIAGASFDGHAFIGKAVRQGAVAVVYENEEAALASLRAEGYNPEDVPAAMVKVQSTRKALAYLSANFYDNP